MAITFTDFPVTLCQSGNPMSFSFQSDKTSQPNFVFIVEVYLNTVLHSTHTVYPENGNLGRFDLSQIAEFELSRPLIPPTSNNIDSKNYGIFKLVVREFYGATPAIGASAESPSVITYKAKSINLDDFTYTDYMSSSTNFKVLSHFSKFDLFKGQKLFVYTLLTYGQYIKLTFYDKLDNSIAAEDIQVNDYIGLGVNLSYNNLEGIFTSVSAYSFDEVAYVEFRFTSPVSIVYRINLTHVFDCFKPTRVHWLNTLGGIDSFSFNKPLRRERVIKSSSYSIAGGAWEGTRFVPKKELGNFQTESSDFLTLTSGNIGEKMQKIDRKSVV